MFGKLHFGVSTLLLILTVGMGAARVDAQGTQGPMKPPPPDKSTVKIPTNPSKVEVPPVPPDEIIRALAQKEEAFLQARGGFSYQKTVRVVELDENGKVAGEFQYVSEGRINSEGGHFERIIKQPSGALSALTLQPQDLEILWRAPLFPFTPAQLPKYEITYAGKQQVDELSTYLFQVKPKQVDRAHAYFEGAIWVDDRDLCIVKAYGKWVMETGDVSTPEVPFVYFETYRENIEGKFWFPTYVRSDAMLKLKDREVPLRLTIRWTDYKPFPAPAPIPKNP